MEPFATEQPFVDADGGHPLPVMCAGPPPPPEAPAPLPHEGPAPPSAQEGPDHEDGAEEDEAPAHEHEACAEPCMEACAEVGLEASEFEEFTHIEVLTQLERLREHIDGQHALLEARLDRQLVMLQSCVNRLGDVATLPGLHEKSDQQLTLLGWCAARLDTMPRRGSVRNTTRVSVRRLSPTGSSLAPTTSLSERKSQFSSSGGSSPEASRLSAASAVDWRPIVATMARRCTGGTGDEEVRRGRRSVDSFASSDMSRLGSNAFERQTSPSQLHAPFERGTSPVDRCLSTGLRGASLFTTTIVEGEGDTKCDGDATCEGGTQDRSKSMSAFGDAKPWRRRCRNAWQFLEDPQSSNAAWVYGHLGMLLVLACLLLATLGVLLPELELSPVPVLALEALSALELVVRFGVCPNRHIFWLDPYNLVDLLAISASAGPRLVSMWSSGTHNMFSPFLILLRCLRRFEHFQLLRSAFVGAAEALPVLLYTMLVIASFFCAGIYILEPRDNIPTMWDAAWFTLVTMFTVSFGDIAPVSAAGKALTTCLIVASSLYMAIPYGIVGSAFSKVWKDRERLILMHQLRRRVSRAGYTPRDLAELFQWLDGDGNRQLSFEEFQEFLPMLRINMSEKTVRKIFEVFDDVGEGTIDFASFLLGIFPAQRYYLTATGRGGSNDTHIKVSVRAP